MSLHYPFLFPHAEEGWHTKIPLTGIDLANNVNLQAHRHMRIELEEGGDEGEADDDATHCGRGGSSRVSQAQYYAFQFQNREGVFSPILHAGRLNQEYVVDAWVCVESNRLNWARTHQAELRVDCYNGLQDAMGAGLSHGHSHVRI